MSKNTRGYGSMLALFIVVHGLLLLYLHTDAFAQYVAEPVYDLSAGLVTSSMTAYLTELVVLGGALAGLGASMSCRSLGLTRRHAYTGLIIGLLLWGTTQLTMVAIGTAFDEPVRINPKVWTYPKQMLVGRFLENLFGSGLTEEIIYRGWLLPVTYAFLDRYRSLSPNGRLYAAIAASQAVFGLNHVFTGAHMGLTGPMLLLYLVQVTCMGIVLALGYLRTGNLYVAIVIHTLANNPVSLLTGGVRPSLLIIAFGVVLLVTWPLLARYLDDVFTVPRVPQTLSAVTHAFSS